MPIDLTILNSLRTLQPADNPGCISRLLHLFLSSTQDHIANLKIALNNNNLRQMTRVSHSMKSMSGNVGALQLMKLCEELEINCRRNQLEDTDKLIVSISEEFDEVKEHLEIFINTLAGAQNEL